MVLRILPLAYIVFLRTTHATTVPASVSQICSALGEGNYANTSLFGFIRMLAGLAALN